MLSLIVAVIKYPLETNFRKDLLGSWLLGALVHCGGVGVTMQLTSQESGNRRETQQEGARE